MKIKVFYSKQEFQATIDFISNYNHHFYGQKEFIKECLLESIDEVTKQFHKGEMFVGTMGYIVEGEVLEEESMDGDENVLYVKFLVDPSLSCPDLNSDSEIEADAHEEIYEI